MDRFGRRPLLIGSVAICVCCLICEAAILANFGEAGTNKSALAAGVAMFFIYAYIYSIGYECVQIVYLCEIFPNHIRAKGFSIAVATIVLSDLIYVAVAPVAFANVQWKFYLVRKIRKCFILH